MLTTPPAPVAAPLLAALAVALVAVLATVARGHWRGVTAGGVDYRRRQVAPAPWRGVAGVGAGEG